MKACLFLNHFLLLSQTKHRGYNCDTRKPCLTEPKLLSMTSYRNWIAHVFIFLNDIFNFSHMFDIIIQDESLCSNVCIYKSMSKLFCVRSPIGYSSTLKHRFVSVNRSCIWDYSADVCGGGLWHI